MFTVVVSLMPKDKPFPRDVVRDLVAITRALYRAELAASSPNRRNVDELEQIGQELNLALDLGKNEPGSLGCRAAWVWADQATTKLGELVANMHVAPAVRATVARMKR
jgi:hypothetical protein